MVGRIFRRFETGESASRQIASGPLHRSLSSTLDMSRAAPHRVPLRFLTEARITLIRDLARWGKTGTPFDTAQCRSKRTCPSF